MTSDEEYGRDVSDAEFQKSLVDAIHEASPEGILVVDGQGMIVSHNQRMLEVWASIPRRCSVCPMGAWPVCPIRGFYRGYWSRWPTRKAS